MNDLLQRLESAYSALQPREQVFVRVGGVLVALLLLLGIPLQLHRWAHQATARVATKTADLAYLQSVAPLLAAVPPAQDGVSLLSVVDATTRDAGLASALRGTEPSGNDSLRVRFEGVAFDQLTRWLMHLGQDFGIGVQQATLEHTDTPGQVNASIVLVRR
jgi:type II secretory pathway component PulM